MKSVNNIGRSLHNLRKIRWFEMLHHGYVVVAIIGIAIAGFGGSVSTRELAYVIAFLIYFLVLLIFLLATVYMYGMKARYSEALISIHTALHSARDLYRSLDWWRNDNHPDGTKKFEEAYVRSELSRILTSLAQAFAIVSGVKCRAAIKVLKGEKGLKDISSIYVTTLSRDAESLEMCRERDAKEGARHLVVNNSDFYTLVRRQQRYFICHDVTESEHYRNSSFELYPDMQKYKSTIVWPIRYVYKTNEVKNEIDQELYGFLAIDSYSKKAFNERYDVDLGAIVADSLFPVMQLYWELGKVSK